MESITNTSEETVRCCGFPCWKKKQHIEPDTSNQSTLETDNNKLIFCGDLPQPLLPGHCIEVVGAPLSYCSSPSNFHRFSINFQCSKDDSSDIAFHFNPRLDMKYVVRNSRQRARWESEETVSPYRFELPRNERFRLQFFIAPREFMVAVNGQHFCTFPYRLPLQKTRYVVVSGDVTVDGVDIKEMTQYPNELPVEELFSIPFQDQFGDGSAALPNPFIGHLPKGLQQGWQLEVHGKVKLLPHSFYVNLQEGNQYWPHPIIPLHLNTRFNTTVQSHSLIRNTWQNGAWGQEEVSPGFHFVPGRQFRLVVQLDGDTFLVWVDGQLEGEFKMRTTSKNIDTVYIQGDLYLQKVFVLEAFTNVLKDYY